MASTIFVRDFPHTKVHEGAMLGNGWLGLYVWGGGHTLRLTVGCGDLWDHRGGLVWSEKRNFGVLRQLLESRDEAGVKAMFQRPAVTEPRHADRPSLIPVGRFELVLPADSELLRTEADYGRGVITAVYRLGVTEYGAEICLDMTDKGSFACRCKDIQEVRVLSSFSLSGTALYDRGFEPPATFEGIGFQGFVQGMPADGCYGVVGRLCDGVLSCRFQRGDDICSLRSVLESQPVLDWSSLVSGCASWWGRFWSRVPSVTLGNKDLESLYYEGLCKFEMMTAADGVPAGLQGPWIEDDALPPWSGDYHFNINVEMCYWPAYRGNLCENLLPLFEMLKGWRVSLRKAAKHFVGIDDGYMMSCAVDDRGVIMGGFWPGTIDLGCGAWVAQMMYDYVDYTGDVDFLRDWGFEFMTGVFNVCYASLEWRDGLLCLPVSVSPEYGGASMDAWGSNASFQLASIHRLSRNLQSSAQLLGVEPDSRWEEVETYLPQVSVYGSPGEEEIGLWDGAVLAESHRHHSHLGCICPFDTLDWSDVKWRDLIRRSVHRWIRLGMGQWSGWCMPWAAMLHSHLENGRMSELILEMWRRVFLNAGGGSLHDGEFAGVSVMGFGGGRSIMQMDGMMGAVTAIQDMLLHNRQDTLHVFSGINPHWEETTFENMPAPGGCMVSATRQKRGLIRVVVTATRDMHLKLVVHDDRVLTGHLDGCELLANHGVFECDLACSQTLMVCN